jgi:hypothetical protein
MGGARRTAGIVAAVAALLPAGAPSPVTAQPAPTPAQVSRAQLEDLAAPIALYPDPLLSQVLMAATYGVQVVQADRWLADPVNAALRDGDLAAVVSQQTWDPSIKSLIPFPGILAMMDVHLDWTQSLGEAFVLDPAALMDAVQDLRRRAMAAGELHSTADLTVNVADGVITIIPAAAPSVYYPIYDPDMAYGSWPYPDAPPYVFQDTYDSCGAQGLGACWVGVVVALPLWGWQHCDWRRHRIQLDPDRFAALNNQHRPPGGTVWVHQGGAPRPGDSYSYVRRQAPRPADERVVHGPAEVRPPTNPYPARAAVPASIPLQVRPFQPGPATAPAPAPRMAPAPQPRVATAPSAPHAAQPANPHGSTAPSRASAKP